MHTLWVFYYFFQKSLFAENYSMIAAINLTIRGPLNTCLVWSNISIKFPIFRIFQKYSLTWFT